MPTKPTDPSSRKRPLNIYAKYSAMGFQMAAIIFGFTFAGIRLDEHYGMKSHVFTTSLALFSIFLAIYLAIRDFIRK